MLFSKRLEKQNSSIIHIMWSFCFVTFVFVRICKMSECHMGNQNKCKVMCDISECVAFYLGRKCTKNWKCETCHSVFNLSHILYYVSLGIYVCRGTCQIYSLSLVFFFFLRHKYRTEFCGRAVAIIRRKKQHDPWHMECTRSGN